MHISDWMEDKFKNKEGYEQNVLEARVEYQLDEKWKVYAKNDVGYDLKGKGKKEESQERTKVTTRW